MSDRLPRKLAAILYADVAEYSRLTGDDEDATHKALREYLDLISDVIQSHRGFQPFPSGKNSGRTKLFTSLRWNP